MNVKKIIVMGIAVAALGMPLASATRADYGHDHSHRQYERRQRFEVHYHMDGEHRLHLDSHREAHRVADSLRAFGAETKFIGDHEIRYHMHGERKVSRYSYSDARELADSLRRLGFHVHIDRD